MLQQKVMYHYEEKRSITVSLFSLAWGKKGRRTMSYAVSKVLDVDDLGH